MNRIVAVVALLLASVPVFAVDPLAKKLEAVMDGPEYKRSHWGVLIVDAKTGDTVYERNADKLFVLASCSKLFSTAAVLAEFGSGFRFETPVFVRGQLQKGVLRGDLILRASGDPSFGGRNTKDGKLAFTDVDHSYANGGVATLTADTDPLTAFTELAEQVKASGITEVAGEVLVDDRLFARTRTSGSGPEVLSPMTVNDNVVDVVITPGAKAGEPAKVTSHPQSVLVNIDAEVSTGEAASPTGIMLNQVGPGQFTVRGSVPANGKVVVRALPVDDPAGFARGLFIEALRKAGVKVAAAVARPGSHAPPPTAAEYAQLPTAGVFTSAPMGELLKVTLKTSNNLYGTALPCLLAAKHGKMTQEDGLKLQRKQLKGLGVELDAVSLVSGAGGNGHDLASPRATVQLLQGLRKRDDWATYRGWLPTMGGDGTLTKTVDKDSPAYGKVSAKTGTFVFADTLNGRPLLKSKTLAGAMTAADGRELLFAVFVTDSPLEPNATADKVGKSLAHLCEIVIADGK